MHLIESLLLGVRQSALLSSQAPIHDRDGYSTSRSPFSTKFNETVDNLLQTLHLPGFSIAVVHGSETFAAGYGLASIPNVPATPDTLYYAGSTSKAFTSAAVSILVDNSSLSWDTPISSIIRDDFVLSDDWATTHITVEDALSHRTGLPRHDSIYGEDGKEATSQSVVRNLRHLPFTAEPRTRFQYCNVMFTTIGHVIEQISGKLLGHFMREHIWEPLNMISTYSSVSDASKSSLHFATGYVWRNETQRFIPLPYTEVDQIGGAGFIISTVNDYAKWIRSLIYQDLPLSKEGHSALISPRTIVTGDNEVARRLRTIGDKTYSLGWERHVYRGFLIISHDGALRGYGTHVLYIRELEWGAVMMGNNMMPALTAEKIILFGLLDDLLGVPKDDRFDYLELYHNQTREAGRALETAEKRLYPDLPLPHLPKTLHLTEYAGTYRHPAYGSLSFRVEGKKLSANMDRNLLAFEVLLTHLSGEFWLATLFDIHTGDVQDKLRAEFRVGSQGHVTELGIELEGELAKQGSKIWFSKTE